MTRAYWIDELAYDGDWVTVRGIKRPVPRPMRLVPGAEERIRLWAENPAAMRRMTEEAMFTDDEAAAARRAYEKGDRSDRARIGARVYWRRMGRRKKAS